MIAETTGELRLVIPAWGGIILAAIGIAYIILGTWWPRPLDVLSMTVLGCLVGLVACAWVPLAKPVVIIIGGLLLGGLTAFFRNVCHAILSAAVLAAVLATLAALAAGGRGVASYLVLNLSNRSYSIQLSGPNLACDPVLAACLAGLLIGAAVAVGRFALSERLVLCVQGAALVVVGLASVVSAYRGEGGPSLAAAFPLTLSVLWACLVVIGLVVQTVLMRWRAESDEWDGGADVPDGPGT